MSISRSMSIFLLGLTLWSSTILALDGQRKGFLFGAGAGLGYGSTRQTMTFSDNPSEERTNSHISFLTRLDVGYAPNERLQLSWAAVSSLSNYDELNRTEGSIGFTKRNYLVGFSGVSATYYRLPNAPSLFVGAGIGMMYFTDALNISGSKLDEGLGGEFRVGYEFHRHFSVSLELIGGQAKKTWDVDERKIKIIAAGIVVNWLGY